MRYILSGGGTAGHINPAIAIADKLKEKDEGCEIVFVGSQNGMENKLVPLAGYPIWQLDVKGLKRSLSPSNVKTAVKAIRSVKEAKRMIECFRPDAVIGTGGYVCFPILYAASKCGIYTAIHESNAVPGLAVKLLKNRVDRIFTSFPACADKLKVKDKCLYTGDPLKSGFEALSRDEAREKLGINGKYRYLIVSFGGSLGAQTVNELALDVMERFTSKRSDILHIHGCGKSGSEAFFEAFKDRGLDKCRNISASEYIYDMPTYLKAADAVMCRSGAMTLAELAAAGTASVLVPSPNVTGNHQYKNALEYAEAGAAFLVDERNLSERGRAVEYMTELITNKYKRKEMEQNVMSFARLDASEAIVNEILRFEFKR